MKRKTKLLLVYLNSLSILILSLFCPALLAYENSIETLKRIKVAKVYLDHGQPDKAKAELEIALQDDPKSPDVLNNLGGIYLRIAQNQKSASNRNNDLEKARTYFTQALDVDPDFSSAWNGLADTYYLSGQTQQAIAYYKKAIALSPKRAYELQTNLANAQRDLGLKQEAEASYQKAIESNPLYAPAHNGYAELLLNKHEINQAYNEILEAIRLKPNYATAYYHLGLGKNKREKWW